MTLKKQLQAIDTAQMGSVVESMIDKGNALGGAAVQVDNLWQQFPALQTGYEKLMDYFSEGLSHDDARIARVASVATLLALREYAEVDEMYQQFPDAPKGGL